MTGLIGPFWAARQPFVVESDDDEMLAELDHRLGDLRTGSASTRDDHAAPPVVLRLERTGPGWMSHPWAVWRDGEACELTLAKDYIVPYLLWEVTRLVLEAATLPMVPVHAAGLVRNGRAIALIGPSHSGKSTLSAWLVKSGWGFLTDEVSLVDTAPEHPIAHPFWRPIGVRRPGPLDEFIDEAGAEPEVLVPASRLGLLAGPAPLVALVCPTYTPDAQGSVEPMSPASALALIADQVPSLVRDGAAVFHALAEVVERLPAFTIAVDDLDVAAAQLESLIDGLSGGAPVGAVATEFGT